MQHSLVACLWSVFLGIPLLEEEELPIHAFTTMIASILAFIMPLKLTQLVLYPPLPQGNDGTSTSKKSDGEHLSAGETLRRLLGAFFSTLSPSLGPKCRFQLGGCS